MEGIFFSCSLFLFVVRRMPHFVVLKLLKSQLLARCTFNNCQQLPSRQVPMSSYSSTRTDFNSPACF